MRAGVLFGQAVAYNDTNVGISPGQYQQQLKLARAKELLSSSNLSIAEIAFELNFECVGQFSTFFRKKEGVTPSEFRRQRF